MKISESINHEVPTLAQLIHGIDEDAEMREQFFMGDVINIELLEPAHKKDRVYLDLETTGLEPFFGDTILGIALGVTDVYGTSFHSRYYPFRHDNGKNLRLTHQHQVMSHLLTLDETVTWVFHNARFDLHFLRRIFPKFGKRIWDTLMAAHIANEHHKSFGLKALGVEYFGESATEEERALELLASKGNMRTLTPEEVAPYACKDVELTYLLDDQFNKELAEQGLTDYARRQMSLVDLAEQLEMKGLPLKIKRMERFDKEARKEKIRLQAKIARITGISDFNPNSPVQIKKFTGWKSTAQDIVDERIALGQVEPEFVDFFETLLEFRHWTKVSGTYYAKFRERMDKEERVHPNLNPTGTGTGRFSCSKPNMQSLPRARSADEKIYKVRQTIGPRKDNILVFIDYKQAEMRIAAHFAEEETVLKLLCDGHDLHSWVAEEIFGSDEPYMRWIAKRINFGTVYGIGAKALSIDKDLRKMLRVVPDFTWNRQMASKFLAMYHRTFPGFGRLLAIAQNTAKRRGHIYLFTGRYRRYPDKSDRATRKASSNLVQGTVAEIVNEAMLRCDIVCKNAKIEPGLIFQVHDELVFEMPRNQAINIVPTLVEQCEDWDFTVPMPVDVAVGIDSWGKKIDFDKFVKSEQRRIKK